MNVTNFFAATTTHYTPIKVLQFLHSPLSESKKFWLLILNQMLYNNKQWQNITTCQHTSTATPTIPLDNKL